MSETRGWMPEAGSKGSPRAPEPETKNQSPVTRSVGLALANGQRWVIGAADEDAGACIERLAQVMQLRRAEHGCEVLVAVCRSTPGYLNDILRDGPLLCCLPPRVNAELGLIQMEQVARQIALSGLKQGCLLIHGALAEYRGRGFIMAGHGTVGKSTASRRLPPPWRSLSDDKTLVVRDESGQYWAHPWPTWSRFYEGGAGDSWAVEQAVPLRAVFFLSQSPSDGVEPVSVTQATALTLESANDLALEASKLRNANAARALIAEGVSAAEALAQAVPAFSLKLSLDGKFWEEIERVLPVGPTRAPIEKTKDEGQRMAARPAAGGTLRVVCTGTSMNPTLEEPDLLEVRPYGKGRVRPGDVVCFRSPDNGKTIVRRVVSVGRWVTGDGRPRGGIRTRGDNNQTSDPWVLQLEDIIGQVTTAQRRFRHLMVHGGWRGNVKLRCARLGQAFRRGAGLLSHALHRFAVGIGLFGYLLPASMRPRLVRFDARGRVFLKLLSSGQTVGEYDPWSERWNVRWPFWLFADEQALPGSSEVRSL